MNRLKKLTVTTALIVSAALIFSACNNNESVNSIQNPGSQNTQTGNKDNAANDQIADKGKDSVQEQLVAEFDALLEDNGKLPEAMNFAAEHASKLTPEQVSHLILSLEDAQNNHLSSLEDRYYDGNIQEEIGTIYTVGDTLDVLIDKAAGDPLTALLKETRDSGYLLATAEGMFYPEIDYERLAETANIATEDIAAYVKLKARESAAPSLRDAALTISWDELLDRAFAAEAFTEQHGKSKRNQEVSAMLNNYKTTVFYGANNTPLFDYDNNRMDPEAQKAYESYIGGNDMGTGSGPLFEDLKKFMDAAAKNKYKLTDSLKELRTDIAPMNYD